MFVIVFLSQSDPTCYIKWALLILNRAALYLYHNYTFIWMNAYTYTRWKVEVRPSLEIVFTFLKEKIKEPLFNFDYERASRRPH